MNEVFHSLLMGVGSLILSPAGKLPMPKYRATVPQLTVSQAVAKDFAVVSGDLARSIDKVQNEKQLEMNLDI
jgi:hypothetical protein